MKATDLSFLLLHLFYPPILLHFRNILNQTLFISKLIC